MYHLAKWLQPRLCRVLRLSPEPEMARGGTIQLGWIEEHHQWWRELPWYGHAAERVLLAMRRAGRDNYGTRRQLGRLRNQIDHKRATRALARARRLVYTSPYTHDLEGDYQIEGYFDLGRGLSFGLTIHSLESFTKIARYEWETGKLHQLYTSSPWAEDVVVPMQLILPEQVSEVLRRWYEDRFEWKWNHWTHREDRLPDFEVELEWKRMAAED